MMEHEIRIYKLADGGYVVANNSGWLPGVHADPVAAARVAKRAMRLGDEDELGDQAHPDVPIQPGQVWRDVEGDHWHVGTDRTLAWKDRGVGAWTEVNEVYGPLTLIRDEHGVDQAVTTAADVGQAEPAAPLCCAEPVSGHCSGLYKCAGCGWQFCNLGGGNWLGPRNQSISWSDLQDHYADCSGKLQRIE